jgi:hypothetical protein
MQQRHKGTSKSKRKSHHKPPSVFKKIKQRIRRAKARMAVRMGRETPIDKKDDTWDWN